MNDLTSPKVVLDKAEAREVVALGEDVIEPSPPVARVSASVRRVDPAFSFGLRGGSINPLIDSSSPMMALILRVHGLSQYEDLDDLHKRCKHEIESVELELHRLGYDRVTILAHRYCLCAVLDETIMGAPWGGDSNWGVRSLLATFHDETWGGEKFFVILERLMMEPARYLQIIEFLYLCLCLGFQGKYNPRQNGRMELETLIKEVHSVIRKERGLADPIGMLKAENIVNRAHFVRWQTPVIAVVGAALLVAAVIYAGFFFYTENYTDGVIAELTRVLGTDTATTASR